MYIGAGRVIFKRRHELDGFLNPLNEAPFANTVVTEVRITHEDRTISGSYTEDGAPAGLERDEHGDQIYSVNIEAAPQTRSHTMPDVLNVRNLTRNAAVSNSNAESWLYARVAFLFFLALAITWVSDTPILYLHSRINTLPNRISRSLLASIVSTASSIGTTLPLASA